MSCAVLSLAKADQAGCWASRRGALAMPTVSRFCIQELSELSVCCCKTVRLGGKGAQPAGGLCTSETKMKQCQ